jgi:hypothetical protein
MNHVITQKDVEAAMVDATVPIASSVSAEGKKQLVWHHGRAMYVLTVNGQFRFETTDATDAATAYSEAKA